MSRIYWDTMLFVYWLEGHPEYASAVGAIHRRMEARGDVVVTSVFSLAETLVGVRKQGSVLRERQVREFYSRFVGRLVPFGPEIVGRYADVRAAHRVSPPDAIHLASAAEAGVDLFLTNDATLKKLVIPGIQFIAGLDTDVL